MLARQIAPRYWPPKDALILGTLLRRDHDLISGGPVFLAHESAVSLLLTDLAEDLQARGHEVHVFTSRQLITRPKARLPEEEVWRGIKIHRNLRTSCFGRRYFRLRLADALTFHFALRSAQKLTVKPDAWFVMTEPPLILNTVLKLQRKLGGRVIHHGTISTLIWPWPWSCPAVAPSPFS